MTITMNNHCPNLRRNTCRAFTATARHIKPPNPARNQVVTIHDASLPKSWDKRSLSRSIPRCRTPYPFSESSLSRGSAAHPHVAPIHVLEDDETTLMRALRGTVTLGRKVPLQVPHRGVLNLWQPSPTPGTLCRATPMPMYDINTKLPFHILVTDHVRLEPFVPSLHLGGFMALPRESWDLLGHIGPFPTEETALKEIENWRRDPGSLLLAAIDKRREANGQDAFTGMYGLMEYDRAARNILFGCINLLPRYRRTHINSHAMYLLLTFLFDEVKILRVQYDAVEHNAPSISAAKRFGFKEEGVCRNFMGVVPHHKRREGQRERVSQDAWMSSMTDMDWEGGVRKRVWALVGKEPVDTTVL